MLRRLLGLLLSASPTLVASKPAAAAPVRTILKPVFVPVRSGFRIPTRSNGASRRRKSNRLHLSTKTRNKHR